MDGLSAFERALREYELVVQANTQQRNAARHWINQHYRTLEAAHGLLSDEQKKNVTLPTRPYFNVLWITSREFWCQRID